MHYRFTNAPFHVAGKESQSSRDVGLTLDNVSTVYEYPSTLIVSTNVEDDEAPCIDR